MSTHSQNPSPQVGKLVSVVPVGLKEAALDSPTFRATTLHFSDQIDQLEKWLDGYAKAATKLATELAALDSTVGGFLSHATSPLAISEAVVDHDYTLLAIMRCGDSSRDLWQGLFSTTAKLESLVSQPIRNFIHDDLRNFKESRRVLDQAQKHYDYLQTRYSSMSKSKEPSSLREDAFQLHEARKVYLKASMDFCVQAPQMRNSLDRLLVRISFNQWREFKTFHTNSGVAFGKWAKEMDRIKGWIHEMESGERYSKRELLTARTQIEEAAEAAARPSRELEDYSVSTVPYLGSRPLSNLNVTKEFRPDKQGWVNLRTLSGKPARTVWIRRWAFLKGGIFGCLVQGHRTGGVEESERIGVLLCSVRPAFQEDRRFCFEVKTKDSSIMLQAETQKELMEWIAAFEAAKQKALENPAITNLSVGGKVTVQDPAFAISQPPAPEFAADPADSLAPSGSEEQGSWDRSGAIPTTERERTSTDLTGPKRVAPMDGENSTREHTSRIMQKLDLHRKPPGQPSPAVPGPAGGIASLISASHNVLSQSGSVAAPTGGNEGDRSRNLTKRNGTATTLAPLTLANPPAPTAMSRAAVMVSNERGIGLGNAYNTGGMPRGMMANLWGSSNWGFLNRFEREAKPQTDESIAGQDLSLDPTPSSPMSDSSKQQVIPHAEATAPKSPIPGPIHRQTISLDGDTAKIQRNILGVSRDYPSFYPQALRPQDAQFRLLFPNVKREEPLVIVFRATWNPNEQQEFPGRAYVTTRNIYFYSHHFGLVLTTSVSFDIIKEVTAAPGRDCDFLFLHMHGSPERPTSARITIKTFLEPLRLLQKRLNFLIEDSSAAEPRTLEAVFKSLTQMEAETSNRASSVDSWEDVTPLDDDVDNDGKSFKRDLRAPIYIDKDLDTYQKRTGLGKDTPKFRLPTQPVEYTPQGNLRLAAEKILDINPRALFHVLFGDKSAAWQLLLYERNARNIKQGPWTNTESQHFKRDFQYSIETTNMLGYTERAAISDYQAIDVLNQHLCYVITDKRTPWHLPFRRSFRLISKIVITFVSKSKSKLAVYTKIEWLWTPYGLKSVIDKQATRDLEQDALDLIDLASDQVRRLGTDNRTRKAITIFGHVGRQNLVSVFADSGVKQNLERRRPRTPRPLYQLIFETVASLLESAVSSLIIWVFGFFRWAWKTTSANRVILTLLLSSVLINGLYSSQRAYDWWLERNAGNFMWRLGVHPDHVMSKAIYIKDVDEAIANVTVGQTNSKASDCFTTFYEQAMRPQETSWLFTSPTPKDSVTKRATRRLQQTRERLATYRYNLLVALRVVNSIEKEVVQTEWEHWLQQELRRCNQVEMLIRKNDSEDADMPEDVSDQRVDAVLTADVRQWYEKYCTSCQREQQQVEESNNRQHGIL